VESALHVEKIVGQGIQGGTALGDSSIPFSRMHLAKVSFVESTPPHDRESAAAPLATWAQLNHGAWRDDSLRSGTTLKVRGPAAIQYLPTFSATCTDVKTISAFLGGY
jgi:hypothetical protein